MPWWVSDSWLKEHGCVRRDFGDAPIPFVWMPDSNELPKFDLATYGKIDGERGLYELEWFSLRGTSLPPAQAAPPSPAGCFGAHYQA